MPCFVVKRERGPACQGLLHGNDRGGGAGALHPELLSARRRQPDRDRGGEPAGADSLRPGCGGVEMTPESV